MRRRSSTQVDLAAMSRMFRVLRDFVTALTYPPALSLCLLLVGSVAAALRRRRSALALIAIALGWSLLWSVPRCSQWLRATLEDRYPVRSEKALPQTDAIVVLGGGSLRGLMSADADDALQSEHSRLAAGARAWLAGRAPVIVLSGGGGGRSEASWMAEVIGELGIPTSALILEERSRNTCDNARFTALLAAPRGLHRILLVTSSLHMPRASLLFRQVGFQVMPVPVPEPGIGPGWKARWLPSRGALWRSGRAFKEFAGLIAASADSRLDLQCERWANVPSGMWSGRLAAEGVP